MGVSIGKKPNRIRVKNPAFTSRGRETDPVRGAEGDKVVKITLSKNGSKNSLLVGREKKKAN